MPMAESGQPPLPASAWQAITQTTQPETHRWQVSDRRYLSEGSIAPLTTTPKEVTPAGRHLESDERRLPDLALTRRSTDYSVTCRRRRRRPLSPAGGSSSTLSVAGAMNSLSAPDPSTGP